MFKKISDAYYFHTNIMFVRRSRQSPMVYAKVRWSAPKSDGVTRESPRVDGICQSPKVCHAKVQWFTKRARNCLDKKQEWVFWFSSFSAGQPRPYISTFHCLFEEKPDVLSCYREIRLPDPFVNGMVFLYFRYQLLF